MIIPVQSATAGVYVADLEWNGGAPINNKTFKLYSFVDSVTGTEYLVDDKDTEDTSDDTVDLSAISADATLYAKYNTGIKLGDVNLDGTVDNLDSSAIIKKYYQKRSTGDAANVGVSIYETDVPTVVIGDINESGDVDNLDSSAIIKKYYQKRSTGDAANVGKVIYLINGGSITAEYVQE